MFQSELSCVSSFCLFRQEIKYHVAPTISCFKYKTYLYHLHLLPKYEFTEVLNKEVC